MDTETSRAHNTSVSPHPSPCGSCAPSPRFSATLLQSPAGNISPLCSYSSQNTKIHRFHFIILHAGGKRQCLSLRQIIRKSRRVKHSTSPSSQNPIIYRMERITASSSSRRFASDVPSAAACSKESLDSRIAPTPLARLLFISVTCPSNPCSKSSTFVSNS